MTSPPPELVIFTQVLDSNLYCTTECQLPVIGLLKLYLRIEVDASERAFSKNDVRSTGDSSVQHGGSMAVFAWIIEEGENMKWEFR